MSDERRESWLCAIVMHDGDGPERTAATRILGVHDITADEAAEWYAYERMGGPQSDVWDNGSTMYVAVLDKQPDGWLIFACTKHVVVRISPRYHGERTDLIERQPSRK